MNMIRRLLAKIPGIDRVFAVVADPLKLRKAAIIAACIVAGAIVLRIVL